MDIYAIIILGVIGIAVILAVYVFIKSNIKKINDKDQQMIINQWSKVISESKRNPNNAILDADKILGHTLNLLGYEGSVGEKLKKSGELFKNLNDVWDAHKLRNRIAHEIGMKVSLQDAKTTLNKFKNALKDLGVKI